MSDWIKLDNAGTVFPSVARAKNASIYRVALILKEPVQPRLLQQALDRTMQRYPLMHFLIRKGLFWRYMEPHQKRIIVEEEKQYPCYPLQGEEGKKTFIKVLYFEKRIAIEVFHALTDGSGAVEFLKTLVFEYFKLKGHNIESDGLIRTTEDPPISEENEDGFHRYYSQEKVVVQKLQKAYQIEGTPYEPFGHHVVHGVISASHLNRVSKKHGVSMTVFILSLVLYNLYLQAYQKNKTSKPITVSVPVNLRRFFPTQTLRNFFIVTNISIDPRKDHTLNSVLLEVKKQMIDNLDLKRLQSAINRNVKIERFLIARFIPLFIKDFIVKSLFFLYNDKLRTCTVTNLGRLELPSPLLGLVDRMELIFYPTLNNPINCGICSVGDQLTITFARTIQENDLIRSFFLHLSQNLEMKVCLYSNEWGDFS